MDNNTATNVFDLQESTIWHTNYSAIKVGFPYQIVVDLSEEKLVTGFWYLARAKLGNWVW